MRINRLIKIKIVVSGSPSLLCRTITAEGFVVSIFFGCTCGEALDMNLPPNGVKTLNVICLRP